MSIEIIAYIIGFVVGFVVTEVLNIIIQIINIKKSYTTEYIEWKIFQKDMYKIRKMLPKDEKINEKELLNIYQSMKKNQKMKDNL